MFFVRDVWVNIATEKGCFFCPRSLYLLDLFEKYPLLFYAVEEGVISAEKHGYYAASVLAFSQLLNAFNVKTPEARQVVAHNFLARQPIRADYEYVRDLLLESARQKRESEGEAYKKRGLKYEKLCEDKWENWMKSRSSSIGD